MTNTEYPINQIKALGCSVKLNEPMSAHTSFKIGGPADLFITPGSTDALARLLALLNRHEVPTFILGNGTNLLVSDKGIRGAVIYIGPGLNHVSLIGREKISCGAGLPLSRLCRFALSESLSSLEFAFGIPGSAGGAAYMNAGAYGGEMKDVLTKVIHLDKQGNMGSLEADELDLGYRHSAYHHNGCVIVGLELQLNLGKHDEILAKMEHYMSRRKEKQPLDYPSAGSIFKRPPGHYAGTLIEQCGLKGFSIGGAQVSQKHAGFIVNTGNATCSDVKKLIEHIKSVVLSKTNIELECEVKIVGEM